APVTVRVTMLDYRFVLSRKQVPAGTVHFVVTNRGGTFHDFAVGKAKTRLLRPGQHETITVRFPTAARVAYRCTVAGHAALGMKGTLVVRESRPPPPPPPTTTAP